MTKKKQPPVKPVKPEKYFILEEMEVPLYGRKFVVILTNDKKQLKKRVKDSGIHNIYAHSYLTEWDNMGRYVMVLNFDAKHNNITHGVIAHESIHITNFILDQVNVLADHDNDEAAAYLIGWVNNEAHRVIYKHGKQIHLDMNRV
jgi:hypothetical protein